MLIKTIGMIADDPIVAQFRSLIPLAEDFLEKRGQPGTHEAAVELIEQSLATLHEIGVHQAVHTFSMPPCATSWTAWTCPPTT